MHSQATIHYIHSDFCSDLFHGKIRIKQIGKLWNSIQDGVHTHTLLQVLDVQC